MSTSAQLVHFVNSILLLNHLNRVVIIAAGVSSCAYIFDSSDASPAGGLGVTATFDRASRKVEEFIAQDARATAGNGSVASANAASLLSGALSLALCCILLFRFLDSCTYTYLICVCVA
jgi:transcription initiation factor TFIIH subunit 3